MLKRAPAAILMVGVLATLSAADDPLRKDSFGDPLPDGVMARLGTGRWRMPLLSRGAFLSADGKTIIVIGARGLMLADVATGRSTVALAVRLSPGPEGVLVPRDGRTLIGCESTSFSVWDVASGKMTKNFAVERQALSENYALADGGKYVVCSPRVFNPSWGSPKVTVLDLASGKAVVSVEPLKSQEVHAALSRDGSLLATFAETVQIWDVATGKQKQRFATLDYGASAARFSPDGKLLATSSLAGSIELWDVASGKRLRRFGAGRGRGGRLFFSPDGKQLAAPGVGGSIQVWETATARRLMICEPVCKKVLDIVFPVSGPPIALGARNQALLVWSISDRRLLTPEIGHTRRPPLCSFPATAKICSRSRRAAHLALERRCREKVADNAGSAVGTVCASARKGTILHCGILAHRPVAGAFGSIQTANIDRNKRRHGTVYLLAGAHYAPETMLALLFSRMTVASRDSLICATITATSHTPSPACGKQRPGGWRTRFQFRRSI